MAVRFPIVELRQYTLFGGRRDELIELFERAFIDSQEAVGAHMLGRYHLDESGWRDAAPPAVRPALMRKPEVLRLVPV